MQLVRLIAEFRLTEMRLNHAVRFGAPLSHTLGATRHIADLMDRIEDLEPGSKTELRIKVDFFLARARRRTAGPVGFRDLSIALELMERQNAGRTLQRKANVGHERQAIQRMLTRATEPVSLRNVVDHAGIRCSMYDADHNVIAFSRPNAVFYTRHRNRVVGRHITALVGEQRYTTRARAKMKLAMGGTTQIYTYPLKQPGVGLRVMECEMSPVRESSGGTTGIVMMVDDVTERYAI